MRTQTLVFTCIPAGNVGGRLRLSVLISPRLSTDEGLPSPTLGQFAADWLDWPAKAATIGFQVQFVPGPTLPAVQVGAAPRSDLWTALFKNTTPLRPHEFDPKQMHLRKVRSYPVRNIVGFLKAQYLKVATTTPSDFPSVQSLLASDAFGPIAFRDDERGQGREEELVRQLEETLARQRAIPPGPPDAPKDFLQLKRFHRPRSAIVHSGAFPPALDKHGGFVPPKLDFHDMLSMAGEYPQVLRWFGIVLDIECVPPAAVPPAGTVRVIPTWTPGEPDGPTFKTENRSPLTRYVLAADRFIAAPRPVNPEINDGMLALSDATRYEVVQVDPDGAGIKALDFAANLLRSRQPQHHAADTPETYSLPSLRSGGIAVARVGQALRLVQLFAHQKQKNNDFAAAVDPDFYAEDLTRGYVPDVWVRGKWHPLTRRKGTIEFTSAAITELMEEEGAVIPGTTEAVDGSSPDLYQQESLFQWQGWSLGAPRPGQVIDRDSLPAKKTSEPGSGATDFKLKATFTAAPGTLPKLRYGSAYRVRARARDLAGNTVPFGPPDLPDFTKATPELTYARFEPITQPTLLKRKPSTEGESVEVMVIRSNFDTLPDPNVRAERHVAPPQASQLMAEQHGMFDLPSGAVDKSAYQLIVDNDGTYLDSGTPDPQYPDTRFYDTNSVDVPYLPDPIARGATLRVMVGTSADKVWQAWQFDRRSFYPTGATWPGALPFRIVMVEGDPLGPPAWDDANRVLTVPVPKAEVVRLRLSAHPNAADLESMGIWRWIRDSGLPSGLIDLLRTIAAGGLHWMITPFRQFKMVHAVKQPLVMPAWVTPTSSRALGKTFANVSDLIPINGNSTIRLDVHADWQEPIDALEEPIWKWVPGKAKAFEVPVTPGATSLLIRGQHEFGDTKHRVVNYLGVATTRFAEFFLKRQLVTLNGVIPTPLGDTNLVPGRWLAELATNGVDFVDEDDYTIDPVAGTIARVATGAIPDGAMVRVEYLPGPITRETPVQATLDILNAARPLAPRVLYVVPTFGWEQKKAADKVTRTRTGGGLRVYMERPWWTSGEGELLGVVVLPPQPKLNALVGALGGSGVPDNMKPYVTQWGQDPIWATASLEPAPDLNDFKDTTQKGHGLTLDEVAGAQVNVAGYAPGFDDTDRGLWYADIVLDPRDSYYPFVRLALVRYQPKSVPDAHISRVVLADFAQLAPDRTVSVTSHPKSNTVVDVAVMGTSYRSGAAGAGPGAIQVCVETRSPTVSGDLGWLSDPQFCVFLDPARFSRVGQGTLWTGEVPLPAPRGSQPMRLVIREFERFIGNPPAQIGPPIVTRIVFADSIEI